MDYFPGITPRERYDNEMLREIRKLNENMTKLLERNAQAVEQPVPKAKDKTLQPIIKKGDDVK